jgi:hypothetical protein
LLAAIEQGGEGNGPERGAGESMTPRESGEAVGGLVAVAAEEAEG